MRMIWEREFASTTLQNFAAERTTVNLISIGNQKHWAEHNSATLTSVSIHRLRLPHFLRMRRKGFATSKVVTTLLSMALEDDPLEILLQNNAESIALDPWALKTYPVIRNGLLGAENESFRDPRMLSTPCTHGIVPLIYFENPLINTRTM